MIWVVEHLDDLESDFSVFHRVEDMLNLDAPRFFRFAHRMPAYRGVMRARVEQEEMEREGLAGTRRPVQQQTVQRPTYQPIRAPRDAKQVELSALMLTDSDLIEWRKADG